MKRVLVIFAVSWLFAASVEAEVPAPVKSSSCLYQCNLDEVSCLSRCGGNSSCAGACRSKGRQCRSAC